LPGWKGTLPAPHLLKQLQLLLLGQPEAAPPEGPQRCILRPAVYAQLQAQHEGGARGLGHSEAGCCAHNCRRGRGDGRAARAPCGLALPGPPQFPTAQTGNPAHGVPPGPQTSRRRMGAWARSTPRCPRSGAPQCARWQRRPPPPPARAPAPAATAPPPAAGRAGRSERRVSHGSTRTARGWAAVPALGRCRGVLSQAWTQPTAQAGTGAWPGAALPLHPAHLVPLHQPPRLLGLDLVGFVHRGQRHSQAQQVRRQRLPAPAQREGKQVDGAGWWALPPRQLLARRHLHLAADAPRVLCQRLEHRHNRGLLLHQRRPPGAWWRRRARRPGQLQQDVLVVWGHAAGFRCFQVRRGAAGEAPQGSQGTQLGEEHLGLAGQHLAKHKPMRLLLHKQRPVEGCSVRYKFCDTPTACRCLQASMPAQLAGEIDMDM
jgi:hypothetical protein